MPLERKNPKHRKCCETALSERSPGGYGPTTVLSLHGCAPASREETHPSWCLPRRQTMGSAPGGGECGRGETSGETGRVSRRNRIQDAMDRRQEANSRGRGTNLSRVVPIIRHHRAEPPASVGRVSRMLKKWEGAAAGDDELQDGEALRIADRFVFAEAGANAFAHQYATVSTGK